MDRGVNTPRSPGERPASAGRVELQRRPAADSKSRREELLAHRLGWLTPPARRHHAKDPSMPFRSLVGIVFIVELCAATAHADDPEIVPVEGQPLAANVARVLEALNLLGAPLPDAASQAIGEAGRARDARSLQERMDPNV